MRITVDERFSYECNEEVEVGDEVILPTPYWKDRGDHHSGTVTSLTGDFGGNCLEVLRVIPREKTKGVKDAG